MRKVRDGRELQMSCLQQIIFDLRNIEKVIFGLLFFWIEIVLLLPILTAAVFRYETKMSVTSVSSLEKVTDADLKKRLNELIDLEIGQMSALHVKDQISYTKVHVLEQRRIHQKIW